MRTFASLLCALTPSLRMSLAPPGLRACLSSTTTTPPTHLASSRETSRSSTGNPMSSAISNLLRGEKKQVPASGSSESRPARPSSGPRPSTTSSSTPLTTNPLSLARTSRPPRPQTTFIQETHLIHIHASSNNTIVTLSDALGNALCWSSAGTCGLKKANRSSADAGYQAATQCLEKADAKGTSVRGLHIKLNGFGKGRDQAFRAVIAHGWTVSRVSDVTPVAFAGCRPSKRRRL